MPIRIPSQVGRTVRGEPHPAGPAVRGEVAVEVTAPFLEGVRVASRRLSARAVSVELAPTSHTGKRARVMLSVPELGLGNATVKSLSLGMPWHREQDPGQPLTVTQRGDLLTIEVPEVLGGWS